MCGLLVEQIVWCSVKDVCEVLLLCFNLICLCKFEICLVVVQFCLDFLFFNGYGGFIQDGCEYVIIMMFGQKILMFWVNVIVNVYFGSVILESGVVYIWSENVYEYCFMLWENDLVSDLSGEVFYLCDEESGYFWLLILLFCVGSVLYVIWYGFGYSVFEYEEDGICLELIVYIDMMVVVKFLVLKICNYFG